MVDPTGAEVGLSVMKGGFATDVVVWLEVVVVPVELVESKVELVVKVVKLVLTMVEEVVA